MPEFIGILVKLIRIEGHRQDYQITPTSINPLRKNVGYPETAKWMLQLSQRVFKKTGPDGVVYWFPADMKKYELTSWMFHRGNITFKVSAEHLDFVKSLKIWNVLEHFRVEV